MAVDSLEEHVKARLDDQVAAIASRIYPDKLPDNASQKTLPAVRYSIIGEARHSAMGSDSGDVTTELQVDVYASGAASRRTTADAVRAAFQRYRGTTGTHEITASFVSNGESTYESEAKMFRMRFVFTIWHKE